MPSGARLWRGVFCYSLEVHIKKLSKKYMPTYLVDIWFDQKPERLKLGTVKVQAENEPKALREAEIKTEHWVMGETINEKVNLK